jgi:hypothetical protein
MKERGIMPELKSSYIGELRIKVTKSHMLGEGPLGMRRVDELASGHFEGPRVNGTIVDGADILLGCADGAFRPDVRLVVILDDGKPLLIQYRGVRHGPPEVMARIAKGEQVDPSLYYLRTVHTYETGSQKYGWLNRIVAVGVGRREPDAAVYEMFEVL